MKGHFWVRMVFGWVVRMLGSRHALIPQMLIPTRGFIPQKNPSRPNGIYKKQNFMAAKRGITKSEKRGHHTPFSLRDSSGSGHNHPSKAPQQKAPKFPSAPGKSKIIFYSELHSARQRNCR
jgi:hypothetical protein